MTRLLFALVVAAAVWVGTRPAPAPACAVAKREGESVDIADEAAYIVWDEKAKTEHFIRRASFAGTSADFGFLVPTPNRPQLEVADEFLFTTLALITEPKVEYQTVTREVTGDFGIGCFGVGKFAAKHELAEGRAPGGGVEVLEQKRVGDFDAAVLSFRREPGEAAATGAAGLAKWLADHGYQSSPALQAWLEWYVEHEWCMTAFKIATGATPTPGPRRPHDLHARPIRMSFKAERPFYPYREPATDAPAGGGRLLRVFVAAPARFAGTLGGDKAWPGQTVWAGPVDANRQGGLFKSAELAHPPAADGWWLTEFEDRSAPRPGTDEVYFGRAADQTPVARPTRVVTRVHEVEVTPWWQVALLLSVPVALALGGRLAWRLVRRG